MQYKNTMLKMQQTPICNSVFFVFYLAVLTYAQIATRTCVFHVASAMCNY